LYQSAPKQRQSGSGASATNRSRITPAGERLEELRTLMNGAPTQRRLASLAHAVQSSASGPVVQRRIIEGRDTATMTLEELRKWAASNPGLAAEIQAAIEARDYDVLRSQPEGGGSLFGTAPFFSGIPSFGSQPFGSPSFGSQPFGQQPFGTLKGPLFSPSSHAFPQVAQQSGNLGGVVEGAVARLDRGVDYFRRLSEQAPDSEILRYWRPLEAVLDYLKRKGPSAFDSHPGTVSPQDQRALATTNHVNRRINLWKPYFEVDVPRQVDTVIHETCHLVLGVADVAYIEQRIFRFLKTGDSPNDKQTALDNADSYVYALSLAHGEPRQTGGTDNPAHDFALGIIEHICSAIPMAVNQVELALKNPGGLFGGYGLAALKAAYGGKLENHQVPDVLGTAKAIAPILSRKIGIGQVRVGPETADFAASQVVVEGETWVVPYINTGSSAPYLAVLARLIWQLRGNKAGAVNLAKAMDAITGKPQVDVGRAPLTAPPLFTPPSFAPLAASGGDITLGDVEQGERLPQHPPQALERLLEMARNLVARLDPTLPNDGTYETVATREIEAEARRLKLNSKAAELLDIYVIAGLRGVDPHEAYDYAADLEAEVAERGLF